MKSKSGHYKRRYHRRSFRKRFNRYRKHADTGRLNKLTAFPTSPVIHMRYCSGATLTSTLGTIGTYNLKVNSIFDPDGTGVGHQPLGHDQWSAFFSRYTVLGSKTTAVFNSSNASIPMVCGLYLTDSPTVGGTSVTDIQEQGKSKYIVIQPNTNGNNASQFKPLVMNYSAKRWHQVKDAKDADTLEANFGSDPVDLTYVLLYVGPFDGSSTATQSIFCQYQIDFIVCMKDPNELSGS